MLCVHSLLCVCVCPKRGGGFVWMGGITVLCVLVCVWLLWIVYILCSVEFHGFDSVKNALVGRTDPVDICATVYHIRSVQNVEHFQKL